MVSSGAAQGLRCPRNGKRAQVRHWPLDRWSGKAAHSSRPRRRGSRARIPARTVHGLCRAAAISVRPRPAGRAGSAAGGGAGTPRRLLDPSPLSRLIQPRCAGSSTAAFSSASLLTAWSQSKMPPDQSQGFADLVDDGLGLGTHGGDDGCWMVCRCPPYLRKGPPDWNRVHAGEARQLRQCASNIARKRSDESRGCRDRASVSTARPSP